MDDHDINHYLVITKLMERDLVKFRYSTTLCAVQIYITQDIWEAGWAAGSMWMWQRTEQYPLSSGIEPGRPSQSLMTESKKIHRENNLTTSVECGRTCCQQSASVRTVVAEQLNYKWDPKHWLVWTKLCISPTSLA